MGKASEADRVPTDRRPYRSWARSSRNRACSNCGGRQPIAVCAACVHSPSGLIEPRELNFYIQPQAPAGDALVHGSNHRTERISPGQLLRQHGTTELLAQGKARIDHQSEAHEQWGRGPFDSRELDPGPVLRYLKAAIGLLAETARFFCAGSTLRLRPDHRVP